MMRRLFGLSFGSTGALPGFTVDFAPERTDVRADLSPTATSEFRDVPGRLRHCSTDKDASGNPLLEIHEIADGGLFRLTYCDGTTFVLDRNGTSVKGSWTTASTLADTMVYFLGPVAGALLYLRGVPCLHASAIVVRGKALLFVGSAEAGKSTTAAAFAKRGYRVITDDIAALGKQNGVFVVRPGVPRVLLWPPSVEAIWGAGDALPLVVPNWDKRYLDLSERGLFQETHVPLGAVYVLEDRVANCEIGVSPLGGAKALMRLVANKYFSRFSEPQLQATEFSAFSRLASCIPVRRVTRPDDRSRIDDVCDAILGDFDSISAPTPAVADTCV